MADPVSVGIQIGLTATSMALSASRKIEGPRLDNLKFNGGDYGTPLFRVWGTRWVTPPAGFGDDLREVKRRRKTKGGKYNDYSYFGTWLDIVVAHPADAVRKIKLDGHLVLDLSGAGPVTPFEIGLGGDWQEYVSIYLGAEDQLPDPRIQATVEARHGEGSCPAYRGKTTVAFKELPLDKFGNRIPQASFEVLCNGGPAYPYESFENDLAPPVNLIGFSYSPDYTLASWGINGEFELWDMLARQPIALGTLPLDNQGNVFDHAGAIGQSGQRWLFASYVDGNFHSTIYAMDADGTGPLQTVFDTADVDPSKSWWADDIAVLQAGDGRECVILMPLPGTTWIGYYLTAAGTLVDLDWSPTGAFVDAYGDIWVCGAAIGGGATACHFMRIVACGDSPITDSLITATGLDSSTSTAEAYACHYRDDDVDHFVLSWDGDMLYTVSTADGSVTNTRVYDTAISATPKQFRHQPPGRSTIWLNNDEIACSDLSTVRTVNANNWDGDASTSFGQSIYNPPLHAIIGSAGGDTLEISYLDRVSGEGVTLRSIVESVCELSGIDLDTIDATTLTQIVPGYSVTLGSGKDWLTPLLDIYDVDPRPHGFKLQFVRRGGSAGAALNYGGFARPEGEAEPLYASLRPGGTDLPVMVSLHFADLDAEQQPNSAHSPRIFVEDSRRVTRLDLATLALDPDEARALVGRYQRRVRFDGLGYRFALPASAIALEPADVHPVTVAPSQSARLRLQSMILDADRRIAVEWRFDDPSVANFDGIAGAPLELEPSVIPVPLLSKGFVIDGPYLTDADARVPPLIYALAGPYGEGTWPGALLYREVDGEYSDEAASWAAGDKATWGTVDEAFSWTNPNVWDRGTVLTVRLRSGSVTGATEAAIDANRLLYLAAIGTTGRWEYVQFANATLIDDGVYELSGFKRGRRGTEWAAEMHAAGDFFVLLDAAAIGAMGLSDVGEDLSFKAVTNGRSVSGAFPIPVAPFTGASLKPYAPCHLDAVKESNGDWTLSWVRRTRVGGAWTSGSTIPLGEASEAYALTVGDGVSSAAKTVSAAATYTWTVAAQTADTGAEVMEGDLEWSVAQVSDAVGAGFLAEAAA